MDSDAPRGGMFGFREVSLGTFGTSTRGRGIEPRAGALALRALFGQLSRPSPQMTRGGPDEVVRKQTAPRPTKSQNPIGL